MDLISSARQNIGHPFAPNARGPHAFDCVWGWAVPAALMGVVRKSLLKRGREPLSHALAREMIHIPLAEVSAGDILLLGFALEGKPSPAVEHAALVTETRPLTILHSFPTSIGPAVEQPLVAPVFSGRRETWAQMTRAAYRFKRSKTEENLLRVIPQVRTKQTQTARLHHKIVRAVGSFFLVLHAVKNEQTAIEVKLDRLVHYLRPAADGEARPVNRARASVNDSDRQTACPASPCSQNVMTGEVRTDVAGSPSQPRPKHAILAGDSRRRDATLIDPPHGVVFKARLLPEDSGGASYGDRQNEGKDPCEAHKAQSPFRVETISATLGVSQ